MLIITKCGIQIQEVWVINKKFLWPPWFVFFFPGHIYCKTSMGPSSKPFSANIELLWENQYD